MVNTKKKADIENLCEFCNKQFSSDKTLLNHICERKRRYMQKDDKHVKMAFIAYCHFFKRRIGKKEPTYESFMKSNLYTAFVKFGRHLQSINAINPIGYIDFLIRTEVSIDSWDNYKFYERYVLELTKSEEPLVALERNFLLMDQWSVETGENWIDFFRKVAPSQAVLWIQSGRLSPWVLLTADSSSSLMERLSMEQLLIVNNVIDSKFWELKINKHLEEVNKIQNILEEAGI